MAWRLHEANNSIEKINKMIIPVISHFCYLLPGRTRTDKECKDQHLHLRLDLLVQSLQLIHVGLLSRPANAHTFLLVGLGDHVEVNVVDDLVCNTTVVLQDIEVRCTTGLGNLLCHGQNLQQVLVRDISQLRAVELGNHKRMATAQRLDVQEGKDLVTLKDLEGRDITLDNLAEDASGGGGHVDWSVIRLVFVSKIASTMEGELQF